MVNLVALPVVRTGGSSTSVTVICTVAVPVAPDGSVAVIVTT